MSPIRIAKIETKKLTPPNGDQDAEKLNLPYIIYKTTKNSTVIFSNNLIFSS